MMASSLRTSLRIPPLCTMSLPILMYMSFLNEPFNMNPSYIHQLTGHISYGTHSSAVAELGFLSCGGNIQHVYNIKNTCFS